MRRLFLLCSLTGEFFFGTTAQSQLPGVNLSATSFLDGLPPPDGPGLYGEQYFQYHNSSRLLDHEGNEIALPTSRGTLEAPRVQAWVMLTQLFNQTRDLAEGALASQPHRSCCRDRRKPPLISSASRNNLARLAISSLVHSSNGIPPWENADPFLRTN